MKLTNLDNSESENKTLEKLSEILKDPVVTIFQD